MTTANEAREITAKSSEFTKTDIGNPLDVIARILLFIAIKDWAGAAMSITDIFIRVAAHNGKRYVEFSFSIPDQIIEALNKQGYIIETKKGPANSISKIIW